MKARQRKAILSNFARCMSVSVESILSREHNVELVDNRSMIVAVLMEHTRMRQQDVAPLLNISQASVSKLLTRHHQLMKHPGGSLDYRQRYADFKLRCTLSPHCGLDPQSPKRDGDTNIDDPDQ